MVDLNQDGFDDLTGQPVANQSTIQQSNAALAATPPPTESPALVPAQITTKAPQATTTTTSGGGQTVQKVQTPEEKKLLGQQETLTQQEIDTQKKLNNLNVQKAQVAQTQADELTGMKINRELVQNDAITKADTDMKSRLAEYDARYNDFKNLKYENFWDTKSTGTKIIAALSVALGALGQGISGGKVDNTALKIVQDAMDKDFDRQKAKVMQGKETVGMAKEGIELARQGRDDALRTIDLKHAAALETVAEKYKAKLAAIGVPEAQIQGDATLQKLQQAALDKKLKVQEDLRKEVTTKATQTAISTTTGGQETVFQPVAAVQKKALTPGQEEADKTFAKTYEEYTAAGGGSTAKKNLVQLKAAIADYQKNVPSDLYRKTIANLPEGAQTFFNPKQSAVAANVRNVIQMNLRQSLGAQFTEREGEALMNRAFDPKQTPEENIKRLNLLYTQLKEASEEKARAGKYFEDHNGTLAGYKGKPFVGEELLTTEAPKTEAKAAAPHGETVRQNGHTFKWNGTKYEEVK